MSQIHLCNTFFEKELESSQSRSLTEWFHLHPVFLQLQFLPLLYTDDPVLVTDSSDSRLHLLKSPPTKGTLESWGASLAIAQWAKEHHLSYEMPPWDVVKTVNSKQFSFLQSVQLPGSALLSNEKETKEWIEKTAGPKVLKTAFGTAATGHFYSGFPKKFPLIGEPWVDRVLDFSTQWNIDKGVHFLGAMLFHNEKNGTYLGTFVGKSFSSCEWALEEHLSVAKPLLGKIAKMGFFGNVGIDAYVYRWRGKERLQPIVEINGRKTMSWVALEVQKKHYPGKSIYFSYGKTKKGLLPSRSFERNISIAVT